MSGILQTLLAGGITPPGFSTWDPANRNVVALSNGNLSAVANGGSEGVRGTSSKSSGKWYFEVHVDLNSLVIVGVCTSGWAFRDAPGATDPSASYEANGTKILWNGGSPSFTPHSITGQAAISAGDTISVALDFDTAPSSPKAYFAHNGTWQNSANPATNTGGVFVSPGSLFPAFGADGSCGVTLNVGASAFTYSIPSGFSAWG